MLISIVLALMQVPAVGGPIDVNELCGEVAEEIHSDESGYTYRDRMFRAAGVHPDSDTAANIRAKMQAFWAEHQDQLYCNELNSTLRETHLLRLAIDRNSTEFLNDVIRRWQLDLNHIDRASGGTVLDFVDAELLKAAGTPRESVLQGRRNLLARSGALHSAELEPRH